MQELSINLSEHYILSIIISILLNIVISIIGFIPSTFLTTFNVEIFGVKESLIISFIGESIGASVSFLIYRKGYTIINRRYSIPTFLLQFENTSKLKSFAIILLGRLIPFIPSSVVTLFATISPISFVLFFISSTLGKLPAIFVEVYSINALLNYINMGKLLFIILLSILLFSLYKKFYK